MLIEDSFSWRFEMKVNSGSKNRKNLRRSSEIWKLTLYVVNWRPKSIVAFTNLKRICHEYLEDKCSIAVIDLKKSPELAKQMEIVAIPTLVKTFSLPMRRFIGDLSNTERVLVRLGLSLMIQNEVKVTY
jgi:circadian clock protein KaiB